MISWLLAQGANPNKGNDNKRTPIYRASFNGHVETVMLLLGKGADREIADRSNGEKPFDCAKDDATRAAIEEWDYSKTEALLAERAEEMLRKLEERVETAAEREALARRLVTEELVQKAEKGDCEGLKAQLMEQADEADRSGLRPLVTCEVR